MPSCDGAPCGAACACDACSACSSRSSRKTRSEKTYDEEYVEELRDTISDQEAIIDALKKEIRELKKAAASSPIEIDDASSKTRKHTIWDKFDE